MREVDERTARWFVQGASSGEPMTVEKAVGVLNELFALDPGAADRLFRVRTPCNAAAANHPSITVAGDAESGFAVGILGVINGILMRDDPAGSGVAACWDPEADRLVGFRAVKVAFGPQPGVSPLDGGAARL
jgi:hypothetical protein